MLERISAAEIAFLGVQPRDGGDPWHDQAMRAPIGKGTCRLGIASRGTVCTESEEHSEVLGIGRDH